MLKKREKRYRRHKRVRAKIFGTAEVPRLCVFRSSNHIYAQLIDDEKGKTIAAVKDASVSSKTEKKSGSAKIAAAYEVGKLIAKKGLEKKIKKTVFDRGGYKYHGRVKALAEGARKEGLKF